MKNLLLKSLFSLLFLIALLAFVSPQTSYAGGLHMKVKVHYKLNNGAVMENPPVNIKIDWNEDSSNPDNCGANGSMEFTATTPNNGSSSPYQGPTSYLYGDSEHPNGVERAYYWTQYYNDNGNQVWGWYPGNDFDIGACGCVQRRATVTINGETKTALFKAISGQGGPDGGAFGNDTVTLAELTFEQPNVTLSNNVSCSNNQPNIAINGAPTGKFEEISIWRSDDQQGTGNTQIGQTQRNTSSPFTVNDTTCTPGKQYYYWGLGIHPTLTDIGYGQGWTAPQILTCPSSCQQPQPTTAAGPKIKALKIGQGDNTTNFRPTITRLNTKSGDPAPFVGSQTDQGGSNYQNDIRIALEATPGSDNSLTYYTALYNTSFPASISSCEELTQLVEKIKDGVILKYDGNSYSAYSGRWTTLLLNRYTDLPNSSSPSYSVKPGLDSSWLVLFDKSFGSTTFKTAVCVQDSKRKYDYKPNAIPERL